MQFCADQLGIHHSAASRISREKNKVVHLSGLADFTKNAGDANGFLRLPDAAFKSAPMAAQFACDVRAGKYIKCSIQNMNKRSQGALYRANILLLLATTGYASTKQVARGVWGRCDQSAVRMASRTLRWLFARRLVVRKREGDGVNLANHALFFALTQAGADAVRMQGSSLVASKVHARDYLRHAHSHRTACNSVYVAWPTLSVFSELEVQANEAPMREFRYMVDGVEHGKIPDLIAGEHPSLVWMEVENSWRNEKDLNKIVCAVRAMFSTHSGIAAVHFVVTSPSAKTIGQRLKKLLTHAPDSGWPRQVRELDARILEQHLHVSVLHEETLELQALQL